jgi:hypothetical protein
VDNSFLFLSSSQIIIHILRNDASNLNVNRSDFILNFSQQDILALLADPGTLSQQDITAPPAYPGTLSQQDITAPPAYPGTPAKTIFSI